MNVLITGLTGYLSRSLQQTLPKRIGCNVQMLDMRNEDWKNESFRDVDVVVHCAALVHKNPRKYSIEQYRAVNVDLTRELAEKAKKEGVRQFIFMSTRAVYGLRHSCYRSVVVTDQTPLRPYSKYGITKLEAENILREMETEDFGVTIIRAPMVYGKGCKGNYSKLRKMVLHFGFVPKIKHVFSMLYIGNYCELVAGLIEKQRFGVITPQDSAKIGIEDLAIRIAKEHNRPILYTAFFNPFIRFASLFSDKIKVAFRDAVYDERIAKIEDIDYRIFDVDEAIHRTEIADEK